VDKVMINVLQGSLVTQPCYVD